MLQWIDDICGFELFRPSYGKRICLMGYSFALLKIRFWYWSILASICNVFLWNNIVGKRLSKLTFPWCIILVRQSPTTLCLWDGNILIVWWSEMDFSLVYHLDFNWKAWLHVWKHEPWSWRTFKHVDQPFFFRFSESAHTATRVLDYRVQAAIS
jgi:hypothetical protein